MKDRSEGAEYGLLTQFRRLFEGKKYRHRSSNQGDFVAMHVYEDLLALGRSSKLIDSALTRSDRVLNVANRRRGVSARRGDGTFGEIIPGETPIREPGYHMLRGPIATVEIGIEIKIMLKAMIKQIDRVVTDLRNQVVQFRRGGGNPICVGIVGINQAERVISYEGDRSFATTGKASYLHPHQEAVAAERRLKAEVSGEFDEFLLLRFKATNADPYPFEWVDYKETRLDYAAMLARISARYQQRF